MFYDRERDLADLNDILSRAGAQLMIVSGRRRVGKTTLLIEWARRSGRPFFYWVASRQPAPSLLQSISQALWRYAHPNDIMPASFAYDSWSEVFQQMAVLAADQRLIVILDELTYVIEADDAFTSLLQNAWDHHIKQTQIYLLLAGSHIHHLAIQHRRHRVDLSDFFGRASDDIAAQHDLRSLTVGLRGALFRRQTRKLCERLTIN